MQTKKTLPLRTNARRCLYLHTGLPTLLVLLMLTFIGQPALAQDTLTCATHRGCLAHHPHPHGRLKAHSPARLTPAQRSEAQARRIAQEIALDDATSERFIQTFCDYREAFRKLRAAAPRRGQSLTEAEAQQLLKDRFAHQRQLLDLREKYYGLYSQFLTQKQILRVYQLERPQPQHPAHRRTHRTTCPFLQSPAGPSPAAADVKP